MINEHTGAELKTKAATAEYLKGWDRIFGKKEVDWTSKNAVDWTPEEEAFFRALPSTEWTFMPLASTVEGESK